MNLSPSVPMCLPFCVVWSSISVCILILLFLLFCWHDSLCANFINWLEQGWLFMWAYSEVKLLLEMYDCVLILVHCVPIMLYTWLEQLLFLYWYLMLHIAENGNHSLAFLRRYFQCPFISLLYHHPLCKYLYCMQDNNNKSCVFWAVTAKKRNVLIQAAHAHSIIWIADDLSTAIIWPLLYEYRYIWIPYTSITATYCTVHHNTIL